MLSVKSMTSECIIKNFFLTNDDVNVFQWFAKISISRY